MNVVLRNMSAVPTSIVRVNGGHCVCVAVGGCIC